VVGTAKVKLPDWAQRIAKFRESLGISQTALAEKLNVSPMSVSRWERGAQEPSAEVLIMLGNLTSTPDNLYFWQAAGLSRRAISHLRQQARSGSDGFLPALRDPLGKAGRKNPLVPIPLLRISVGGATATTAHLNGEIETVLAAPRSWCPNPAKTICLHVQGDTMAPLIQSGSVAAVDTTFTNVADLYDKLVIAQHPGSGLLIARLRRQDPENVLTPENPRYGWIPFSSSWTISGKVLWWIGFAP
jgi:SOS-response transcriptional repressor LexA